MIAVGIDKLSFFSPNQYIDLTELAKRRDTDPNKYLIGIGQSEQAVIPASQDVITMAANAADQLLTEADRSEISMIMFATESGVDNSKSGAVYLQTLLGINRYARTIELKQACYAGTYGLMQARDYVALNPGAKVLVVASDIARYGLATAGEVTQGGGAVAMLVTENPKVMTLERDSQFMSQDLMDFWRPVYATDALVDGHFSQDVYREFFKELWQRYREQTGRTIADFQAFAFHLPYTKQGLKALKDILPEANAEHAERLLAEFEASRVFNKRIGNLYTGSLYLSLLSLLVNSATLKAGDRIGLFSYGSGAEDEFYSGLVQTEFKKGLINEQVERLLSERRKMTIEQYEENYGQALNGPLDREIDFKADPAKFVLAGLVNQQRQYINQQNHSAE